MIIHIVTNEVNKALIEISGQLDTNSAQDLAEQLTPLLEDAGKQITLDFSNLEYISSSGLRVLLMLNKKAKEKGGDVNIIGMKENILQLFQIVGFDALFTIE